MQYGQKNTHQVNRSALFTRAVDDAEKTGDNGRAAKLALDWLRACREEKAPYRRLAAIRRKLGDTAGSLDIVQRGLDRFPEDAPLLRLLAELNAEARGLVLSDVCDRAIACRKAGDFAAGLDIVDTGLATFPYSNTLLKLGAKMSDALGDTQRAVSYLSRRAELPEERIDSLLQIARLRLQVSDAPAARAALTAAVEAGAAKATLRRPFARLALLEGDLDTGLALLEDEEAEHGLTPDLSELRKKLGKRSIAKAQEGAPPIRLKSTATSELRNWAQQNGVPTLEAGSDGPRLITPDGDILMERVHGSRAMALVFGGLASLFGGGAEDLGYLMQAKKVNALFFSDPQRLFLLNGLSSIGDYQTSLAWIRELADAWDAPNLYCLGFSAGGYSALRYGVDLNARRILTFAAPTNFAPDVTQVEKRGTALLHRLFTRKPDMAVNLRDHIAGRGADAPEIINYYGELMPEDAYHARNIDGLPTVRSRPIPAVDSHAVITGLRKQGHYVKILEKLFHDSDD